jgi:hypothetical protein
MNLEGVQGVVVAEDRVKRPFFVNRVTNVLVL